MVGVEVLKILIYFLFRKKGNIVFEVCIILIIGN